MNFRIYKLLTYLFLLFLLLNGAVLSQSKNPDSVAYRYWIYFKDKGQYKSKDKLQKGSDAWNIAISGLNEKAIQRRRKVLKEDDLVNYNDLPVNNEYINSIKELGIIPHAVSKWFNAVSIKARKNELEKIKQLGFVTKIEGVKYLENVKNFKTVKFVSPYYTEPSGHKLSYGKSYWQNKQINVPILHDYGITGYGVKVGMCDDGFNWRKHEALMTRKVIAEYDWIFKDDSVQNQVIPEQFPSDGWDQDGHGTATMSTLGGFSYGKLIGPAYDAEFYLSKTEDGRSETPVEEDYWLEAVEWMEAQGVEVISSSLIYKPFDKPNDSYQYEDMDGNTTIVVRAADYCVYLGIVVCNSMGNEMQRNPPSIVSPPDGDSVIAVGAVDSAGVIALFSSNGPTSDGRMKPDVVAMGVDVWAADSYTFSGNDSSYSHTSGTSFSCPITAGVCALILSVHPELTPMQVLEALKQTANRKDKPDNVYGWGLINAYEAALYYGMIMSNKPVVLLEENKIYISAHIISKNMIDKNTGVKLFYAFGDTQDFTFTDMNLINALDENNSGVYSAVIEGVQNPSVIKFYITASDTEKQITGPFSAPERFFYYSTESKTVENY